MLSAEELLAGSSLTYAIEVPADVLSPVQPATGPGPIARQVRLRPLAVQDLQTITRAAKESDSLVATLMVQRALVEPELTVLQVASLHVGLVQFLLEQVNRISGITVDEADLAAAVEAPLAKAAFVLSKEFGWTPRQINELTLGQILLHLQLLREQAER